MENWNQNQSKLIKWIKVPKVNFLTQQCLTEDVCLKFKGQMSGDMQRKKENEQKV